MNFNYGRTNFPETGGIKTTGSYAKQRGAKR